MKIESSNETDFIRTTLLTGTVDYWIGLMYDVGEGSWKWSDGTIVEGYINWGVNQPNYAGGDQYCGGIRKGFYGGNNDKYYDGEWHDRDCASLKGFICEKYN